MITKARFAGRPRFGYDLGVERFKRYRFSVPAAPRQKPFSVFQYSLTGKDGSGSWKTAPAVLVLLSVSGKNGSDGSGFRFRFGS